MSEPRWEAGMRAGQRLAFLIALTATTGAANVARAQDTDACINASEKAVALRKAEKLIEQRAALSTCAASSCPDAVRTSCQQRLAQANQAIPSIVFVARDGGGRDLVAVKVTIDGTAYADRLDGSAIALDPGEHEFRFEMAGQDAVVKRFVTHQGEQNRREVIVLGAAATPAGAVAPSASAAPEMPHEASAPPAAGAGGRGRAQRTVGVVIGSVGVVSLAAGAIFGGFSMAAHGTYEKDCGSNIGAPAGLCNAQGVSGERDAATKGTLSTVFFVAGGVAAVAGGALFFASSRGPASTQVGVGAASVFVKGQF
ncbi:MAG TPA: hypothetical protein VK762_32685 [Polyangiaceae bacterium]|jgi:hypothetical protein|nr:hypothetical protein [Polyangiaceae bacterium]